MTKRELIAALRATDAPDSAEVLVAGPEPDEMTQSSCLSIDGVRAETAHDDDCTPFVRIYVIDEEWERQEGLRGSEVAR